MDRWHYIGASMAFGSSSVLLSGCGGGGSTTATTTAIPDACAAVSVNISEECSDPTYGPVSGGVDYVDMFSKVEDVDLPEMGVADYSAQLNGYTFWFKNAENRDTFSVEPWTYAPQCGGF